MEDMFRRWKTLQLVEPIYTLTSRGLARAPVDHRRYDVKNLSLAAIDFVVAKQATFDNEPATLNRLEDHVRDLARRAYPDDPDRGWVTVTRLVLDMLLNDGQQYSYEWRPLDGGEPRPWKFRLLRMADSGEGTVVAATDEAIVLYLQALDVDLADREMATKLMLSRQMEAGEFNRARRSAVDARRYAEGVATQLRERLDDTRRDIRAVDWVTDMPQRLEEALATVVEQIDLDRHIIGLAETGMEADDDRSRQACQAVLAEVRRSQDVHVRLEREILRATPVYLEAQRRQRLRPRGIASLVDLRADVLAPLALAPAQNVLQAGDLLARAGLGVRVAPEFTVDDLLSVLLRPMLDRRRVDPVVDLPDDLVELDDENVPEQVAIAAADHLATCTERGPIRLSQLLASAPERVADDESAGVRLAAGSRGPTVADIVWAGALWAWLSATDGDDTGDEVGPRNRHLAGVLATLTAMDDGAHIPEGVGYAGADLLVARAHHLLAGAHDVDDDALVQAAP